MAGRCAAACCGTRVTMLLLYSCKPFTRSLSSPLLFCRCSTAAAPRAPQSLTLQVLAAFLAKFHTIVLSAVLQLTLFTDSVPPLGTRECGRASRLRVCSHLAAAAGQPGEAATSGAVQTLAQQYGRGVTCFRLDLLATADGALLATSPERLQVLCAIAFSKGIHDGGDFKKEGMMCQKTFKELKAPPSCPS